jgi:Tol biopolymer transport system component
MLKKPIGVTVLVAVLVGAAVEGAAPLEQIYTGVPQLWTPAAIASAGYESSPTFTPDQRVMFFLSADAAFLKYQVMQSRCEAGGWSSPEPAPFSAPLPVIEADPFVTHDGKRLYYISSRHDPKHEDFDIWFVDRTSTGGWSEPQRLPEPVNSPGSELLPRQDGRGSLYFGSDRAGGHGQGDIYIATLAADGQWQVSNVGPPVNTAAFEYEAEVSRDGSTLVVVANRTNRSHLYQYKWRSGRWVEVGQIPAAEDQFQVGPLLSPNGDRLLFAQRDGERSGEIFLLDLAADADPLWPPQCR